VVTAAVARRVAAIARPEQVEEAHLCGLLASTGRVGLAVVDPEAHLAMVERFGPDPGDEIEEECLGIGSTEFGAILLGAWGLPSVYSWAPLMAAGRRPTVEEGPEVALLAPVLELAGLFGRAVSNPEHADLAAFRDAAEELLGMPAADLATVLAGLPAAASEALGELGIDGDAVRGLVRLLERDAVASAA
jgi:HD-like signal output (HDOD) protein